MWLAPSVRVTIHNGEFTLNLLKFVKNLCSVAPSTSPRRDRRRSFAPRLEHLEERQLLSQVFTVNVANDNLMNPPVGNMPAMTLRQAINAANNDTGSTNAAPDTIRFASGLAGRITLTQGELDITRPVVIDGPGASTLTIDAQQQSRVIAVLSSNINVTLDSLTITGGKVGGTDDHGGGVWNAGNLTIHNCVLSGNSAGSGAITGAGGAIYNSAYAMLTITGSTLSGNSASEYGGGIDNDGNATLQITNSTLYNNSTTGDGGALDNLGAATLTSVTVTGNVSATAWGAVQLESFGTASLLLHNSIVAGNFLGSPGGSADDLGGSAGISSASSYNLIGAYNPTGSAEITAGVNHNQLGVSAPLLGSLADNGGQTPTCAVLANSPALGAGDPSLAGTTDQRGIVRGANVTIGAYQDAPLALSNSVAGFFVGPYGDWSVVYRSPSAHPHRLIAAGPFA
jgi:hypothetical protein